MTDLSGFGSKSLYMFKLRRIQEWHDRRLLNVVVSAFDRICGNHGAELLKSCENYLDWSLWMRYIFKSWGQDWSLIKWVICNKKMDLIFYDSVSLIRFDVGNL